MFYCWLILQVKLTKNIKYGFSLEQCVRYFINNCIFLDWYWGKYTRLNIFNFIVAPRFIGFAGHVDGIWTWHIEEHERYRFSYRIQCEVKTYESHHVWYYWKSYFERWLQELRCLLIKKFFVIYRLCNLSIYYVLGRSEGVCKLTRKRSVCYESD